MSFLNIVNKALLINTLLLSTTQAASMFPRGCDVTGYGFAHKHLVLNETGAQTLYLIQNHSNALIELEHVETQTNVFLSPKLETKMASGRWSAFASDTSKTYFKCSIVTGPEHERVATDCQDHLDVCQYSRVKFALSNMGTYWVSTDKTQTQVITDATKKGIYLRWR